MALFSFLLKNKFSQLLSESGENDDLPIAQYKISGTERDYDTLDNYDMTLKFWLPEAIVSVLDEMCNHTHTTKSDLIRQTLFIYLYGRYDLMGLIERGDNRFALNSPSLFSRAKIDTGDNNGATNRTPELGKNTEDIKVRIASKMKDDLLLLASQANLPLSHFIREILISNLLGHTYLPERDVVSEIKIDLEENIQKIG